MRKSSKYNEAIGSLSPEQYRVSSNLARKHPVLENIRTGHLRRYIVSGESLFASSDHFAFACRWSRSTKPIEPESINDFWPTKHGMIRTEVRSAHADSHLGHVFFDAPKDRRGLCFCIDSASLRFIPHDDMKAEGYGAYLDQVENVR